ncbi:MAG: DUF4150 domain-containing protein [Deltaproteobacteria bacterium]|nr:DUF4150 domain-containing protein [Deltaproteobacteria bacterium]
MARIKIKDLPEGQKISKAEMREVFGGVMVFASSSSIFYKGSGGLAMSFPDVCLTPPSPPGSPVPYPNLGGSSDDPSGSKDTKL